MKIVQVTYSTKAAFAEHNMNNIKTVMKELQQLDDSGIFYNVCLKSDGITFIHTAYFKSEDDRKLLNDLPAFKHFQEELKSRGLEAPPIQELLTLVGSSTTIFS